MYIGHINAMPLVEIQDKLRYGLVQSVVNSDEYKQTVNGFGWKICSKCGAGIEKVSVYCNVSLRLEGKWYIPWVYTLDAEILFAGVVIHFSIEQ